MPGEVCLAVVLPRVDADLAEVSLGVERVVLLPHCDGSHAHSTPSQAGLGQQPDGEVASVATPHHSYLPLVYEGIPAHHPEHVDDVSGLPQSQLTVYRLPARLAAVATAGHVQVDDDVAELAGHVGLPVQPPRPRHALPPRPAVQVKEGGEANLVALLEARRQEEAQVGHTVVTARQGEGQVFRVGQGSPPEELPHLPVGLQLLQHLVTRQRHHAAPGKFWTITVLVGNKYIETRRKII